MGILDTIVAWLSQQVMNFLDLITGSVLGALGTDLTLFLRYFPAAETLYSIFVAVGIGFVLLNLVWQLFRNFGLGIGLRAEEPLQVTMRCVVFLLVVWNCGSITQMVLNLFHTPYGWLTSASLPPLDFASFGSVLTTIIGGLASGSVALIVLVLVVILAWNYLKLLLEAAERYIVVGVLVYTAPAAVACGCSESTANVFHSWCRMLAGQLFLLLMNAWCLRLFTSMVGTFLANPLSV